MENTRTGVRAGFWGRAIAAAIVVGTLTQVRADAPGPEFRVSWGQPEWSPSVAIAPAGDFVVAWAATPHVLARRYSATAQPLGDAFEVSVTAPEATQVNPEVAMAPDGSFAVAWVRYTGSGTSVLLRRFDATGTPLDVEFPVADGWNLWHEDPEVAFAADGSFYVVWWARAEDGTTTVRARHFTAYGVAGPETIVAQAEPYGQPDADVAVGDDGVASLVWLQNSDVQFARVDANGSWMQSTLTTTSAFRKVPRIARNGDGFVVAWLSYVPAEYEVMAQRVDLYGSPLDAPAKVNTAPAETPSADGEALAVSGGNAGFVVAWQQSYAAPISAIYLRRFAVDGTPGGDETPVSTEMTSKHPSVALDGDGDFVAVYASGWPDSPASIYGRRFVGDGAVDLAAYVDQYGVQQVHPGDAWTWIVRPYNGNVPGSDGAATGVSVALTVTGDAAVEAISGDGWGCAGAAPYFDCQLGNPLSPGAISEISVTMRAGATAGTMAQIEASVVADQNDPNLENNTTMRWMNIVEDPRPDPFTFVDLVDVTPGKEHVSNEVTISGMPGPGWIAVGGGEYSIDGGPFTNAGGPIQNGQTVRVRHVSSNSPATTQVTNLFVGDGATGDGYSEDFTTTTFAEDKVPDPFVFPDYANVPLNTLQVSNTVSMSGLNAPASIVVYNGEYSINSGPYTSAPGTIQNGEWVKVRHPSSAEYGTTVVTSLFVGDGSSGQGVWEDFRSTTLAPDAIPDPFSFDDRVEVERNMLQASNAVTMAGLNAPALVRVEYGEYSIDGGPYTSAPGTIQNGQTLRVRHVSGAGFGMTMVTTIFVGDDTGLGVWDNFETTTITTADTLPDPFAFPTETGVERATLIASDPVVITGINDGTPVAIADGEYSIDGAPFTTSGGLIRNGQSLLVRHVSAAGFGETVTTSIAVGEAGWQTFASTTRAADTTPAAFAFVDLVDQELYNLVISSDIVVAGIEAPAAITVTGGTYSVDGGPFVDFPGTVASGQRVRVEHRTADTFRATVNTVLTIGGVSDTFSSTTRAPESCGDSFQFSTVKGTALGGEVISNPVTMSGFEGSVAISVAPATSSYSIDGGAFTSAPGTVTSGRTVRVRHQAASTPQTTTETVLTAGCRSASFSSETAYDDQPDPFDFPTQYDVPPNTEVTSAPVTVTGIDVPVRISAMTFSVNGGPFTSTATMVVNGDVLRVRHTSSANYGASVSQFVYVGYFVHGTFTSYTQALDTTPDPFTLTDVAGVERNTEQTSNPIVVAGINSPAAISVSSGTYSIDGGPFVSAAGSVSAGQYVRVRHTSAPGFSTRVTTTLTIGGVAENFESTTLARDVAPDAFGFPARTDVARSTTIASDPATISGINDAAPISVIGGAYSIDGGAFVTQAGTIANGQTVRVRHVSSSAYGTSVTTTLTVGGVSAAFTSTTLARDLAPDAFAFAARTGVARSATIASDARVITGINDAAPVTVAGGEYSIGGGPFTSAAGLITNGQTLQLRHVSSDAFSTSVTTTVTVGGVTGAFTSTTEASDTMPDPFAFAAQTDVPLNSVRTSETIVITGLNDAAPISVVDGVYSVDGGVFMEFTQYPGTIRNGQTLRVRHMSSDRPETSVNTILTIGGVSAAFTSTTVPRDTSPTPFTFVDQADVAPDTVVTSESIRVTGVNDDTPVSVVNGAYSIEGGPFTSAPGTVRYWQTLRVQHTSASAYATAVDTTLTIGGVSDTFTSTTMADTVPDAFSFTDQADVARSTVITSAGVAITGLGAPAPIAVSGGEYSIDGAAFTAASGTVESGQTVRVRHTSSTQFATSVTTTLTVGGVADGFTSTTLAMDQTPDAYDFADLTGVERGITLVSEPITITGINTTVSVTVHDGEYSIDGGAFTAAAGPLVEGQSVRVRHTSAATFSTQVITSLRVGTGADVRFESTTLAQDVAPDPYDFADLTDVERDVTFVSEPVTITGINDLAPISMISSAGRYSIDGGPFTSAAGTIASGQTVRLQHTSAAGFSTTAYATISIGGVYGVFQSTTLARDVVPDAFGFPEVTNVARNTVYVSDPVTLTGINDGAFITVQGGEYSMDGGAFTSADSTILNGQVLRLRQVSSPNFWSSHNTTVWVGGVRAVFTVTTELEDTTPAAFAFTDQSDVATGTTVTSNTITVAGINSAATVSVSGGSYSVNGSAFTSSEGAVSAGDQVRVRHTSADAGSSTVTTTLTIGGVSDAFSSTTGANDTTPNAFSFTDVTGVRRSARTTSNTISVSGINAPVAISVAGGDSQYSKNGGGWTSAPGTVVNGDTVRVRVTSASTTLTTVNVTVTIGGVSDVWSVTTGTK